MIERELSFYSAGLKLAGTLAIPAGEGPFPAALLIVGSGMVDRNENHKSMPMNVYNELAHHLAGLGIASLRFDKRGVGASEGSFLTAGFFDNVADATAAFSTLRELPEIDGDRVALIGHSEGALIATRMAAEGVPASGIALLAGTAQSGEAVLKWQGETVVQHLPGFQRRLMRLLRIDPARTQAKLLSRIRSCDKAVMRVQLVVKLNAKWMREFIDYNPATDLPRITIPILAVTGSNDIQVDPRDIELMRKNAYRAPFEGHVVSEVSHILRRGIPGTSDYKRQVREPLDTGVVSLLLQWIERVTGSAETRSSTSFSEPVLPMP